MEMDAPFYGLVVGFVGSFVPKGWLPFEKATYPRKKYPGLAALYPGANASSTDFELSGGEPPKPTGNVTGKVRLIIAARNGIEPEPEEKALVGKLYSGPLIQGSGLVGTIVETDAGALANGWTPCDGHLIKTAEATQLYSIIGPGFGGDGARTFAVPNLSPRVNGKQYALCIHGYYPEK